MDIASLLPLINMLNQVNNTPSVPAEQVNSQPVENAVEMSQEDKDFIKQNTSMFPESFVPPKDFPRPKAEQVNTPPTQQRQSTPNMDLNALLPLLNSMAGNSVNTEQIAKLMSGFKGGGDIGGLINLVSSFSQNKLKNNKQSPSKQIINNHNQNIIFTE